MGDWGGQTDYPYTTPAEVQTAKGLDMIAAKLDAKFCLALGDNFYHSGITTDVHDHRFQSTFENVYEGSNLQGEDFFRVIAGNHDHYGNVTAQLASDRLS